MARNAELRAEIESLRARVAELEEEATAQCDQRVAVIKEVRNCVEELEAERDAAWAQVALLRKAAEDVGHDDQCGAAYGPISACDCWRKELRAALAETEPKVG
jgi:uncharacterized coiled-coil DUF342 family protein